MTKEEKILLKKKMTKKQFEEFMKSQRSNVSSDMNTGTRTIKTEKDYSRSKGKKICREYKEEE